MAAVAGFAGATIGKHSGVIVWAWSLICLVALGYMGLLAAKKQYWMIYNENNRSPEASIKYEKAIINGFGLPAYRTKWVDPRFWSKDWDQRLNIMALNEVYTKKAIPIHRIEPRKLGAQVNQEHDGWVVLGQYFYPGWTASLRGGETQKIKPVEPEGLISVFVPAGVPESQLEWTLLPIEKTGWIIGGIGLVLCMLTGYFIQRKQIHAHSVTESTV